MFYKIREPRRPSFHIIFICLAAFGISTARLRPLRSFAKIHYWSEDHNVCPIGFNFPHISFIRQIPPHTPNHFMLQNQELSSVNVSAMDLARARRLIQLLRNDGFVYLFNHSVPEDMVRVVFECCLDELRETFGFQVVTAFELSREFFNLPWEEEGDVDLTRDEPGTGANPIKQLRLRDLIEVVQDTMPNGSNPLMSTLMSLQAEGVRVTREVLQLISVGLDLEGGPTVFERFTRGLTNASVKRIGKLSSFFYYSLEKGEVLHPKTVFLSPHADFGLVTLIYQQHVGGLEVASVNGGWTSVDAIPGSIVMIPGSALQILSAGVITPTLHRVSLPAVLKNKDGSLTVAKRRPVRQSICHFVTPDDNAVLEPLNFPRLTTKQLFTNVFQTTSSIPNVVFV